MTPRPLLREGILQGPSGGVTRGEERVGGARRMGERSREPVPASATTTIASQPVKGTGRVSAS